MASTIEPGKATDPLNALVFVCIVSRGCDYPIGHNRSFYAKNGLATMKWLLWGLTSSYMNTFGLIKSTRVSAFQS